MAKYRVAFTQYYEYEVEAESESEAEDLAYEEFESEMRRPIANTCYDDVEVECMSVSATREQLGITELNLKGEGI